MIKFLDKINMLDNVVFISSRYCASSRSLENLLSKIPKTSIGDMLQYYIDIIISSSRQEMNKNAERIRAELTEFAAILKNQTIGILTLDLSIKMDL